MVANDLSSLHCGELLCIGNAGNSLLWRLSRVYKLGSLSSHGSGRSRGSAKDPEFRRARCDYLESAQKWAKYTLIFEPAQVPVHSVSGNSLMRSRLMPGHTQDPAEPDSSSKLTWIWGIAREMSRSWHRISRSAQNFVAAGHKQSPAGSRL